ncbi:hypothetical protein PoHVEF18_008868 [Penicillium ochrochloron]
MPSNQFHHDRRTSCDSPSSESESSTTKPTETPELTSSTVSSPPSPSSPSSPPPPFNSSTSATPSKKRKCHTDFPATVHSMSSPLTPFVNNESGQPHPEFPKTHLAFHLLTSCQLDTLARHYHQVHPAQQATLSYPFQIRTWVGIPDESYVDVATKRRRFGYFIGMPGLTDPVNSGLPVPVLTPRVGGLEDIIFFEPDWECCEGEEDEDGDGDDGDYEMSEDGTDEDVLEWMAREWEDALRKARDSSDGPFQKY